MRLSSFARKICPELARRPSNPDTLRIDLFDSCKLQCDTEHAIVAALRKARKGHVNGDPGLNRTSAWPIYMYTGQDRGANLVLTFVVLCMTLTFLIWAHGDGKRTLFFVWRKVLSLTRGFRLSRHQAKAQQRVAKPKLDVAPGEKSRTCFDT